MDVSSPAAGSTVTTPVHFVANAEAADRWSVNAADGKPLYTSSGAALDAWVLLPQGEQTVEVTALDGNDPIASEPLPINVAGVAIPAPPPGIQPYALDTAQWTVQLHNILGKYQNGQILPFDPPPSPPPNGSMCGLRFEVIPQSATSGFTNGLIEWHAPVADPPLNALWTFLFNVPADPSSVAAYESDCIIVAAIGGSNCEFNFSGQYARVPKSAQWQWESWAKGGWIPIPSLPAGAPFANGGWHQLTIFYQRVTPAGYQAADEPDANTSLLYAVAMIDDDAMLWNVMVESQPTTWMPQVKVQHQIDVPPGTTAVDKWITGQTLTTW